MVVRDDKSHLAAGLVPSGEQARLVKTVKVHLHPARGLWIRPSVPPRSNLSGLPVPVFGACRWRGSMAHPLPGIAIDWVTSRSSNMRA